MLFTIAFAIADVTSRGDVTLRGILCKLELLYENTIEIFRFM